MGGFSFWCQRRWIRGMGIPDREHIHLEPIEGREGSVT
jgi:hypothetical protein